MLKQSKISKIFLSLGLLLTFFYAAKISFAQVMYKKESPSLAKIETQAVKNTAVKLKDIKLPIDFVSPAEPDTESPLVANEEKLEALNDMRLIQETVDDAAEAHNMLEEVRHYKETAEEFHKMEEKYAETVKKLQNSEQCSINFIGKYFTNSISTWSGIKLGENANRHDLRKGISGWAVEAFETAKAAETNAIKTDDIEMFSLEDGAEDTVSDDPDMSLAEKETDKIDADLSPSKIKESQDEMRNSSLLSWQIGAEAAKMLGDDAKKWGSRTNKSMIWTDSKRFYKQYLRRKYDNVKAYLKRYTKDDVLAVVIAKLNKEDKDITETNYQKKLLEIEQESDKNQADSIEKMRVTMQEYDAGIKSKLELLMKQRKEAVVKVDKIQADIRKDRKNIADLRSTAEEQDVSQTDATLNAEVVFPENEKDASTSTTTLSDATELSGSVHAQNEVTLDKNKVNKLEKNAASNVKSRDIGNKKIQELDVQIARAKATAQAGRASNNNLSSIISSIKETLGAVKKDANDDFSSAVTQNISSFIPGASLIMEKLTAEAENSVARINEEVDAIVDGAYQQIVDLGDKVYTGEAYQQIVDIHNNMINQIMAIKLVYSVAGVINIDDMLVYAKLLTIDASPEEEGFFVGAMPKARDMKAPHKMISFEALPVREIFHFDVNDFDAIKPYNEASNGRSLTASEFLNFGGDIPAIWKHILQDKAFIESEYNLKEALSGGCEETAFSRGGIMPCIIDGTQIVMDVDKEGNYIKRTEEKDLEELKGKNLPKCYHVKLKRGKPHHTVFDGDVIFKVPSIFGGMMGELTGLANKPQDPEYDPINCEYSELGMLLEADENNNLSFKERAYKAYTKLQDTNTGAENLSDQEKNELAAAAHAILDHNQIGDFLHHVEMEMERRKNLDEARQDYEEQTASMKEKLQKFGYTPSSDFDITKPSDYNMVIKKLKDIRKEQTDKAQGQISEIPVKDNAPAEEQKKSLNQMLSLIKKDSDGLVQVNSVNAERSDVDELVKKATADEAVVDKLKNSLKEKEKEYSDVDEVFCGNYE